MAKQTINLGTSVNKGDGDPLRTAFTKINQNFDEIYAGVILNNQHILPAITDTYDLGSPSKQWRSLYLTGSTVYFNGVPLSVTDDGTLFINNQVAATPGGDLTWDSIVSKPSMFDIGGNVIGIASSNTITEETVGGTISETTTIESQIEVAAENIVIAKRITQVVDDGVVVSTDATGSQFEVTDSAISIKRYVEPDGPNNSSYFQVRAANGGAILEGVQENIGGNTYGRVTATQGVVAITTSVAGADKEWAFDYTGDLYVPTSSAIRGSNDLSLVSSDDGNSGVFVNGNSLVGTAVLYATNNAVITADYDGNRKDWNFDKSGTITVPLLLPKSFTAVLDSEHKTGAPLTLTDTPWEYGIQFQVNPDGTVQTLIDDPVRSVNPGYVNGHVFRFTEADHGIPGYTFDLSLTTIVLEGSNYVAAVAVTQPPEYPATVKSLGAIKLTANDQNFVFGTDGALRFQDGVSNIYSADPNTSGGINGIGVVGKDRIYLTITNNDGSYQWDFRDYGLADYSTNRRPAIMFPGNSWIEEDLTNQSLNGGMFGPLLIGSQDKLTLRTNLLDLDNNGITPLATYDWEFGKDGKLKLPVGGDIVDSNGNTVLGGNASTGTITFDGVKIIGNTAPGVPFNAIGLVPDNRTVDGYNFEDNGQFLVVYPTTGFNGDTPHIHIAAGTGPNGTGDLILGDDNLNVEINHQGYVTVKAYDQLRNNNHYWTFSGESGTLFGPGMGTVIVAGLAGAPGSDLYLTPGGVDRFTSDIQFADADGTSKSVYTVDTNTFYIGNIPPIGGASLWYQNGSAVAITSIIIGSGTATFNLGDPVTLAAGTSYTVEWPGTNTYDVRVQTDNGDWRFKDDGSFSNRGSFTRTTTPAVNSLQTSAVIWTGLFDYISGAKLTIQLETDEVGDATGWHSQVCEAVIASRGYANSAGGALGDPIMTVYGVTYTSTTPLATFTVQRNPTTKLIEVVATRTAATTDSIAFRIYSVETATRD